MPGGRPVNRSPRLALHPPGGDPGPAADPGPEVGAAQPLSAAYCAERAAQALHRAESAAEPGVLLAVADGWRRLGVELSQYTGMQRPREPEHPDARYR